MKIEIVEKDLIMAKARKVLEKTIEPEHVDAAEVAVITLASICVMFAKETNIPKKSLPYVVAATAQMLEDTYKMMGAIDNDKNNQ